MVRTGGLVELGRSRTDVGADLLRVIDRAAVGPADLTGRTRAERLALLVVDDLGVDVFVAAEDGKTQALCGPKGLAHAVCPTLPLFVDSFLTLHA